MKRSQTLLIYWVNTLLFIAVTTLLLSKKTNAFALGLLAVTAIVVFVYQLLRDRKNAVAPLALSRGSGQIIAVFGLVLVTSVFFYAYHDEALRFLDKPVKLLLFALVLLLLLRYCFSIQLVLVSVLAAAVIAGGIALYEVYFLSVSRAFSNMIAIQGGDIAMSLGLFSGMVALYAQQIQQSRLFELSLFATTLGIVASLLSGTRGAWVCLPLVAIYALFVYRKQLSMRRIYMMLIVAGLAVIFLYFSPTVSSRLQAAASDIALYQQDKKVTSIGYRFELWRSAGDAWQEKPWLGWGNKDIVEKRKAQEQQQYVIKNLSKSNFHAHNQYLEELSIRGLLGFSVFMAFLLIPFRVFARYRHHSTPEVRLFSHLGVLHIVLIATYCLSQAFFAHNSGILFYALMLVVFYAGLHHSLPGNPPVKEGDAP